MISGEPCIENFVKCIKERLSPQLENWGFSEDKHLSFYEYWHQKFVFIKDDIFITVDCEPTRGCGIDLMFGQITNGKIKKYYSFLTYMRLIDPYLASELGYSIPKDSIEIDELIQLYVKMLTEHKENIVEDCTKTVCWVEEKLTIEFANRQFPVGDKFRGE